MDKILITKLVLRPDNRVDLYQRGHRYKDTTLFDVSDLMEVGLDPATLQVGVETPCRFYAHVTESDKLNKSGNPYLDVERLEAANGHKDDSPRSGAVLAELRAIREELSRIYALLARDLGAEPEDGDEPPPDDLDDPPEVAPAAPERSAPPPLNEDQARRAFGQKAGPAIREGSVTAEQVNELTRAVVKTGWGDALRELEALIGQAREIERRETVAA